MLRHSFNLKLTLVSKEDIQAQNWKRLKTD